MEYKADGVCRFPDVNGVVDRVDARQVVVRTDEGELKKLPHHQVHTRSNQDPLSPALQSSAQANELPSVRYGRWLRGTSTRISPKCADRLYDLGRLDHEDVVLLNERMVRDDVYTSIHIEGNRSA